MYHHAIMKIDDIVLSLSGSFILLWGIASCYFGLRNLRLAQQSLSWPSVPGQITVSEIQSHNFGELGDAVDFPVVRYSYSVRGVKYEGSRISYGDGDIRNLGLAAATEIVDCYRKGEELSVYYNPDRPSDSVLMFDVGTNVYTMLRIGIVCLLIGTGMVCWFGLRHLVT